jgi:hypothetical protein
MISWPVAIMVLVIAFLGVAGLIQIALLVLLVIRDVWRALPHAESSLLPTARVVARDRRPVTSLQSVLTVSAERGKSPAWTSPRIRINS